MTENSKLKIKDYLKKNLKKSYTIESLRWALIRQGYSRTAIEQAIIKINKEFAEATPILKEKPIISYQIIDENNNPIEIKKSFWKRIFW